MNRNLLYIVIFSIIVNILLVSYIFSGTETSEGTNNLSPQDYPFLSKRIFVENQNDILINFVPLRQTLNKYAETNRLSSSSADDPTFFGMYFEYLPSGISIGINEKIPFVAASLLKVPIIMGAYKYIESGNIAEDSILTIQEKHLDPSFGNLWKRGVGAKISVAEAIAITLQQSDNTSNAVLFDNIPSQTLDDVFNYLDIPNQLSGNVPIVTPKNYSSILRSLYLSTYLKPENSHTVLKLLTDTPFKDKMRAGIPIEIPVAHKIGVHESTSSLASIFTDCGIVYASKRPYILCMMMRDTEENTRIHMKEVSRIIYEYVTDTTGQKRK